MSDEKGYVVLATIDGLRKCARFSNPEHMDDPDEVHWVDIADTDAHCVVTMEGALTAYLAARESNSRNPVINEASITVGARVNESVIREKLRERLIQEKELTSEEIALLKGE